MVRMEIVVVGVVWNLWKGDMYKNLIKNTAYCTKKIVKKLTILSVAQ